MACAVGSCPDLKPAPADLAGRWQASAPPAQPAQMAAAAAALLQAPAAAAADAGELLAGWQP